MINALPPALIVRVLASLVTVAAWAVLVVRSAADASHLWAVHGMIITATNGVVVALTYRWVFLFVYKMSFADRWWFPLLDGKWSGEIRSNWPQMQAMMLAAKGDGPSFNALSDEIPDDGELITKLEAIIECSLFNVSLEIRVPGAERISRTVLVRPRWCKPSPPQLAYVYDQDDYGRVAVTDAARHRGAAVLDYDRVTGELRGEYWTNRQGLKGLNTAGSVIFRRV